MIVEPDRSVAHAVARVAARRGSTHIVMGTPHVGRTFGRPGRSLVDEIVARDPSLDIVLVGDPEPDPSNAR
jgi:K+-sensing histidine kinase KdpD